MPRIPESTIEEEIPFGNIYLGDLLEAEDILKEGFASFTITAGDFPIESFYKELDKLKWPGCQ